MLFEKDMVGGGLSEYNFTFANSSAEMSIEYWVRSTSKNLDIEHFSLVEANKTWLKISGKQVTAQVGSVVNTNSITTSSTKWSYIVVSFSSDKVNGFVDGKMVFFATIPSWSVENRTFTVVLGSRSGVFQGMISRVYIRNKVLDNKKMLENSKKCKLVPQTPYSDNIQLDWRVMIHGDARKKPSVCGEDKCPAGKTGESCDQIIGK